MVTQIVYAFQSIEKKVMQGRINLNHHGAIGKLSLEQVSRIRCSNLLFCVIFRAQHLVQLGLTAGRQADWLAGRQNTGNFCQKNSL